MVSVCYEVPARRIIERMQDVLRLHGVSSLGEGTFLLLVIVQFGHRFGCGFLRFCLLCLDQIKERHNLKWERIL